MVMGGCGNGPMVGNCGLMGMGYGSDNPMVVVLVWRGFWFTDLLGLCVCVMGFGSPIYWVPMRFGSV